MLSPHLLSPLPALTPGDNTWANPLDSILSSSSSPKLQTLETDSAGNHALVNGHDALRESFQNRAQDHGISTVTAVNSSNESNMQTGMNMAMVMPPQKQSTTAPNYSMSTPNMHVQNHKSVSSMSTISSQHSSSVVAMPAQNHSLGVANKPSQNQTTFMQNFSMPMASMPSHSHSMEPSSAVNQSAGMHLQNPSMAIPNIGSQNLSTGMPLQNRSMAMAMENLFSQSRSMAMAMIPVHDQHNPQSFPSLPPVSDPNSSANLNWSLPPWSPSPFLSPPSFSPAPFPSFSPPFISSTTTSLFNRSSNTNTNLYSNNSINPSNSSIVPSNISPDFTFRGPPSDCNNVRP